MILSLLLTEFCFTILLPLLLLLFWDLGWIFKMLSGWKGNELYIQVSTVVREKLSWGYCFSIISSLLVVFCILFLLSPSYTEGALKFYVQRAPLFIPTVDTLSLRRGSSQLPCIALNTLSLFACVFSVRWVKEAEQCYRYLLYSSRKLVCVMNGKPFWFSDP